MPRSARLFRTSAALALAALTLVLAACGGSGGDPGADPAAIVPARAPVYVEANLKPGDDIEELAKKLSGEEDPGGALKRLVEKEARETDKDFSFSEDVEPWLGDRVGIFFPRISAGAGEQVAALVLPTKDPDAAKEFLEKEIRSPDADGEKPQVVERSHRDTKYVVDTTDDNGVVIIDDYAVFGSDAAIKGALDAREGESLAENADYGKARDGVQDDRVGFMYLGVSQLFSSLGPQGAAARQALGSIGDSLAVGLDGDASTIRASFSQLGLTGEAGATAGPGEVLGQLPASSWLALGVADLGGQIERSIQQLSQLGGLAGQDPEQLLDQLAAELGFDPRRDLAAWMGDIGVFAFGDTPAEFGAGMVAATKDAGAARRAVPRLAGFVAEVSGASAKPLKRGGIAEGVTLSGGRIPLPVHMAVTDDDRFILALTDGALAQALQDTDRLGESEPFKAAAGKLGEGLQPMVFMNFEPLAGFVDATGAGANPNVEKARNALERLTTLAGGSKRDGDAQSGQVVVGVK